MRLRTALEVIAGIRYSAGLLPAWEVANFALRRDTREARRLKPLGRRKGRRGSK